MVKVLLFPLFESQRVVSIEDEPLEIVSTGSTFLAATKSGTINHYSAGVDCVLLHQFRTVNTTILALQYAPTTDCVVTLEKDADESAIHVGRIYYNWRAVPSDNDSPYHSPRAQSSISSLGHTPTSLPTHADAPPSLGVYKLPIPSSITCISVCPATCCVAAATKSGISLWAFNGNSERDFMEKILELDAPNVTHLAIYGPYLAYSTGVEVKIHSLDVCIGVAQRSKAAPTNLDSALNAGPSGFVQDENFMELSFDSHGVGVHKFQIASITAPNSTVGGSTRLQPDPLASFEIFGPLSDTGHRVHVNTDGGYVLNSSVLLIHRRFPNDEHIHSVAFLPEHKPKFEAVPVSAEHHHTRLHTASPSIFASTTTTSSSTTSSTSSLFASSLANIPPHTKMRCLVSTTRQGFIYTLSQPGLLVTYSYTEETLQCCASSCFLYALTVAGLETWTLRTADDDGPNFDTSLGPITVSANQSPAPCLIGMQPFISLQKVAVVGDSVLLLSKIKEHDRRNFVPVPQRTQKKGLQRSRTSVSSANAGNMAAAATTLSQAASSPISAASPTGRSGEAWSLYVLHLTALPLLYNEIISTAASYEESNPAVYYQLVLEGHFLLKSKLALPQIAPSSTSIDPAIALNSSIEAKNYRALLCRSSTLLGNYYFKQLRDYPRAAQQYATSDRSIAEVVSMFSRDERTESALTIYLDKVLFDPLMVDAVYDECNEQNVSLSDQILKHYFQYAPRRLASVILDSSLSCYTQSLALSLLDTIQKNSSDKERTTSIGGKILFARALLYLDQGMVEEAMKSFQAITPSSLLVDFCVANPKLLTSDSGEVPLLGTLLRVCAPWALLEIVVRLTTNLETPELPVRVAISMMRKCPDNVDMYYHPDYDLDTLLLKCFYEYMILNLLVRERDDRNSKEILDESRVSLLSEGREIDPQIIIELANLYIQDVCRHRGNDEPLFAIFEGAKDRENSRKRSSRGGDIESDVYGLKWQEFHKNALYKNRPTWLDKVPPFNANTRRVLSRNPYETDNGDSFDFHHLYLRKCQSLLCQTDAYIRQSRADAILKIIADAAERVPHSLIFSLRVLCLPMAGQNTLREAITLIVATSPQIAFEYGQQFCVQPVHWSMLLSELLTTSANPKEANANTESGTSLAKANYGAVYEQILEYLTGHYDPDAFLHLLPADGNLLYFLPYIEKAFCRHRAKALQHGIAQFMQDLELEQAS